MIIHDSRFADELLQEHLAEAAGMRDRKTDVLIQMKRLDIQPLNLRRGGQRFKKFLLRCGGCGHNSRLSALTDGFPNGSRRLIRCRMAQRIPIMQNLKLHFILYSLSCSYPGMKTATYSLSLID